MTKLVTVHFGNANRTYSYWAPSIALVTIGSHVVVDTPYSSYKLVEVVDVAEMGDDIPVQYNRIVSSVDDTDYKQWAKTHTNESATEEEDET